jgi:hypothetical protein
VLSQEVQGALLPALQGLLRDLQELPLGLQGLRKLRQEQVRLQEQVGLQFLRQEQLRLQEQSELRLREVRELQIR